MKQFAIVFGLVVCMPLVTAFIVAAAEDKPTAIPATDKLPVPKQASLDAAERLVKDIFKGDYSKAKTSAEKLSLAKKLLEQGLATKDDPVGQFVLLREARDLAVEVGSVSVCLDVIEAVSGQFDVDSKKLIADNLVKAAKVTKPLGITKQDVTRVMGIIEAAVDEEDFSYAILLAPVASFIAKNADGDFTKMVTVRVAEIESLQKAFVSVRVARQKLETTAEDPEANLIDGKYLCFLKGDWDTGLKRLTKCSDLSLKTLAEKDLASPTAASDQVSVGDGWWDLADKETGLAKARLVLRAKDWYSKAEKDLMGLTAAKVKKRLEEVGKFTGGTPVVQTGEAVVAASQVVGAVGNKGASAPAGKSASAKSTNKKLAFQQQFTFTSEKDFMPHWKLNAAANLWSIENKSLKFSTPNGDPKAGIEFRYTLDGDIAIEVLGNVQGGSEVTLRLFGEKITVREGPLRVQILRQGNSIRVNSNGRITTIQIKDAVSEKPTGFGIWWTTFHVGGANTWISSVGVKATKGEKIEE